MVFADRTSELNKALLYSKELLNLLHKLPPSSLQSTEISHYYVIHAYIYYKLACQALFESERVVMRSNCLDNCQLSLDVAFA